MKNNKTTTQMFVGKSADGCGEFTINCPVCGNDYSHTQKVYTLMGGDEGSIYEGTVVGGQCNSRRSAVAIEIAGESCGHTWRLLVQQHKGINLIQCEVYNYLTNTWTEAELSGQINATDPMDLKTIHTVEVPRFTQSGFQHKKTLRELLIEEGALPSLSCLFED